MDVELDEDELIQGLKADGVMVVVVKRLRARGLSIETVVVTGVRRKPVLEAVTFGYMGFRIKVYVLRPIRCWKCQWFGHVEVRCQAVGWCPMCGGDTRSLEGNGEQCMKEAVRCNCGGKHLAAYKGVLGMQKGSRLYRSRWAK